MAQYFLQFGVLSLMLLFLITAIHIRYNYLGSLTSKLTSLFLFSVFYATLIPQLILTGLIVYVPHLQRTGTIFGLLAAPLMFLITTTAMSRRKLRWFDALHLLPIVLYIINYLPFFILSGPEKIELLKGQTPSESIYSHSEGWLFGGTVIYDFRILHVLFYLVISVRRMVVYKNELEQWNDEVFNWRPVVLQLLLFVFFYLLPFLVRLSNWVGDSPVDSLQVSFALANLLLVFFFFSNPGLLYGFRAVMPKKEDSFQPESEPADSLPTVVVESEQPALLTDESSERTRRRIDRIRKHLEETRSFLNPEFGLTILEKELGISGKLISQTIKEGSGQNFSGFINAMRIAYVLEKLSSDPLWRTYTVEAMAPMVGYKSPTSFYNNFKEQTGKTPREHIDSLG